jgi:aminoglycoside/choline kinase family phosphotransferase
MRNAQVHVPQIYQQNQREGFLLLEDLGSVSYLDRLADENADLYYQNAFDSLFQLQTRIDIANCGLPRYDEALLKRELAIFNEWFLGQLLDIELPAEIQDTVCHLLIASALEQPVSCVHRDFHSRNLMLIDDKYAGILDFQDAVIGPITYDLVSLLRDCYIAWPEQQVSTWLARYYQRLYDHGLILCDLAQFQRWFDLMGMQRHLKAIGIFSRLHLRDGKSNYLKDIPRTLTYVVNQAIIYPEFSDFNQYLHEQVLPLSFVKASA